MKLLQPEIVYLGHRNNASGIQPIADKVEALAKMPAPTNVLELRLFFGSSTYYSRFIPNLQQQCKPLHHLLQKRHKMEVDACRSEAL